MNTLTRSLLFTAMAAVGLTQGCSCSDDDDPAPVVITPPDPEAPVVTISGMAAKGVIVNGVVSVYPIANGSVDTTTLLGTGTTDSTGHYDSVELTGYDSGPVAVRITSASDGTSAMKCDLAIGCGDGVDFGDPLTLDDSDFTLDAVVPSVENESSVNVSVLTNVAAGVALRSIVTGTSTDIVTAINNANTSVVSRFGLTGNVTQLPIVDVTDPTAVATANSNALKYNLYNAAVVQSVLADNNLASVVTSVSSFTNQWLTNVGLADTETTNDPANVTLAEILSNASNVIDAIRNRDTGGTLSTTLNDLQSRVVAKRNEASIGSITPDPGTPSSGGEPLEKVKAMVVVLGDLGSSIEMTSVGNSTIGTETDAFELQVEAAEMATSAGLENTVEATALTVGAMASAYEAYDAGYSESTWASDDGITVTIEEITETDTTTQETTVTGVKLMVEQAVMVNEVSVAIDMMGTVDGVEITEPAEGANPATRTAMGDVWISGSAEEATVKLEVMDTSKFTASDLMVVSTESQDSTSDVWTTGDIALMLDVVITEKLAEGADPADSVSFTGKLSTSLNALNVNESWGVVNGVEEETYVTSIKTAKFELWGVVANSPDNTGEKAKVSLAVIGDGTGVTFTEMWSSTEGDSNSDNETATNYAKLSATLAFEAQLASIPSVVKASLSLTRSEQEAVTSTLTLQWPANLLTVEASVDDDDTTAQMVTITNQDGVKAVFTDGDDGWTGTITLDGTEYATVDGAIVMYNDGSFGSLDILE